MRKLVNSEEVIDLISHMKGGAKTCVGYVCSAKLPKTAKKTKWEDFEDGQSDTYDIDLTSRMQTLRDKEGKTKKFAEVGIQGILKVSEFVTNWQTSENFNKNARNFERAREDYMVDHGIHPGKIFANRRDGYSDQMDYGENGIRRNTRKDGTQSISIYLNAKTDSSRTESYYWVDEKGDLSHPITKEGVKRLVMGTDLDDPTKAYKPKPEVMEYLFDELGNAEQEKQDYRDFIKAMKYGYENYLLERVLYIVGTVDGEQFMFLNDQFTSDIDGIQIKPTEFKKVAYNKARKLGLTMKSWQQRADESVYKNSKLLTEVFNIKNGKMKKADGTDIQIAYIDPATSENTYKYKDEIKKYGARWLNSLKTWGWFTNGDPSVYNNKIKPCLEYLTSVEENKNGEVRNVTAIIDNLISQIDNGNVEEIESFSASALKDRLDSFKRELMSIVSDKEFKEKMMPIIKFRQAQGHQYSFTNAILVFIQDPKATMVKSRSNWAKFNKTVKPNSKAIALWVPVGGTPLSPRTKQIITQQFLEQHNVESVNDLTPGEKEELRIQLRPKGTGFKLVPSFYDVRFTEQIEGKEVLVGDPNTDLPWFDDSGEETPETVEYCDALLAVIEKSGVKVGFVDDLGGARGVSKSGTIEVLKDTSKNSGLFNTLTHEFAHELLHQKYLANNNADPNGYGQYFIGTTQGRGKVEQQAELCAWIVLRNFGFDMPTNINYVGMWGMDDKSAPKVFDTVANVATRIIQDISKQIDTTMKESKERLTEITGLDVAKLVGCEDVYLRGKEEEKAEMSKRQAFQESFKKTLDKLNNVKR